MTEMFERYTERARRALFIARWEVSQRGAAAVGTEHILLGVLRAPKGLISRLFTSDQATAIQMEIDEQTTRRPPVPTTVEIPFTDDVQRVLKYATDEADALGHSSIGTEHLLLGLLREESSVASTVLRNNGFELAAIRNQVVELLRTPVEAGGQSSAQLVQEIDHLKRLVDRLARIVPEQGLVKPLVEQIVFGLDRLRERVSPVG